MAYFIKDVSLEKPQSGHRYLFDANVWLAVLDPTFSNKFTRPYVDFFNAIINETYVRDASIALPCLLVSEIMNRMINDIFYYDFSQRTPPNGLSKSEHYKKVYRKSPEYVIDVEDVCSSIRAYHNKAKFVSDNLDKFSFRHIIKDIPAHLDINDYLFSKMALEQGFVIVTNDEDFNVEDIHILTTRANLIGLTPI